MTKKLFSAVIVVLLTVLTHSTFGQSNVIKLNVFSPLLKTLNVSYEAKVSASSSFQLGFFYTTYTPAEVSFKGIGITPEYRFYLSDTDAPAGVYVAPFLRYQNFKLTDETTSDEGTFSSFGGGLVIGKQWILKEKIALDAFFGPSYSGGKAEATTGGSTFDTDVFDGFGLRLGFNIGFAF